MYLDLGIVVLDFFYNKGRLIDISGYKRKGHQVGSSHHKMTAFVQAVHDIKAGDDFEEPLSMNVSSCHLRLRDIFALMTMVLDGSSKSLLMIMRSCFRCIRVTLCLLLSFKVSSSPASLRSLV
jgi:hypothetical protein